MISADSGCQIVDSLVSADKSDYSRRLLRVEPDSSAVFLHLESGQQGGMQITARGESYVGEIICMESSAEGG